MPKMQDHINMVKGLKSRGCIVVNIEDYTVPATGEQVGITILLSQSNGEVAVITVNGLTTATFYDVPAMIAA